MRYPGMLSFYHPYPSFTLEPHQRSFSETQALPTEVTCPIIAVRVPVPSCLGIAPPVDNLRCIPVRVMCLMHVRSIPRSGVRPCNHVRDMDARVELFVRVEVIIYPPKLRVRSVDITHAGQPPPWVISIPNVQPYYVLTIIVPEASLRGAKRTHGWLRIPARRPCPGINSEIAVPSISPV
jgi:hypothetical protein